MVEPKGEYTFGQVGIGQAKRSVMAVSHADLRAYWTQTWGQKYFAVNKDLVHRGVKIIRIFLADRVQLLDAVDIMRQQQEAGIQVLVAVTDEVPKELREDYLVQDDEVLVRVELTREGLERIELISVKPTDVRNALSRFQQLCSLSITLDEFTVQTTCSIA